MLNAVATVLKGRSSTRSGFAADSPSLIRLQKIPTIYP
jgi:hypothetical protein